MNDESFVPGSKLQLFEKVQWFALHPKTSDEEAQNAFGQLRKLASSFDLGKLLAGLGASTRCGLVKASGPSEQHLTSFQNSLAELQLERLRDVAALQAAALDEAKHYIVSLQETIRRLEAEAQTPSTPTAASCGASPARDDAANRVSARRGPLATLRRRSKYRVRCGDGRPGGGEHRAGAVERRGQAVHRARRGGMARDVRELGVHSAPPSARGCAGDAGHAGLIAAGGCAAPSGAARVIVPPSGVPIWLDAGVTDLRKGMDGLASQVRQTLGRDPHAGDLYVFRNRRGNALKVLWRDSSGMNMYKRRLERGRFSWPKAQEGAVALTPAALAKLLEGNDGRRPQPRRTRRRGGRRGGACAAATPSKPTISQAS